MLQPSLNSSTSASIKSLNVFCTTDVLMTKPMYVERKVSSRVLWIIVLMKEQPTSPFSNSKQFSECGELTLAQPFPERYGSVSSKTENAFCAMLTVPRLSAVWEHVNQTDTHTSSTPPKIIFIRCVLTGNRNTEMKSSDNYQPALKVWKRKKLPVTQCL